MTFHVYSMNREVNAKILRPYNTLARKPADDASGKYRVGTAISAIRNRAATTCAMISWSKTKPSEFAGKLTVSSTSRRNARYPVWYSERESENTRFTRLVRKRLARYFHQGMPWASAEPSLSREPRTTSAWPSTIGAMIWGTSRGSY